jgi:hypothetical protein
MSPDEFKQILLPWLGAIGTAALVFAIGVVLAVIHGRRAKREWP